MNVRFEPFAWFMDVVVYPVTWVCSPGVREHARAVRYQNDHLDGKGHDPPVLGCGWCWEANKVVVSEETYTDMCNAFMLHRRALTPERYMRMTAALDRVEIR